MKKIILMVAVMATMCIGMNAQAPAKVPAYRGLIERTQPNGYTLRTYLRGDEHKHWSMTEDGWQIKEDKKGWLKYARQNRKGQVVTSCRKAHNAEDRKKCETRWLEKRGILINSKL
jgi:hypothetical protein